MKEYPVNILLLTDKKTSNYALNNNPGLSFDRPGS